MNIREMERDRRVILEEIQDYETRIYMQKRGLDKAYLLWADLKGLEHGSPTEIGKIQSIIGGAIKDLKNWKRMGPEERYREVYGDYKGCGYLWELSDTQLRFHAGWLKWKSRAGVPDKVEMQKFVDEVRLRKISKYRQIRISDYPEKFNFWGEIERECKGIKSEIRLPLEVREFIKALCFMIFRVKHKTSGLPGEFYNLVVDGEIDEWFRPLNNYPWLDQPAPENLILCEIAKLQNVSEIGDVWELTHTWFEDNFKARRIKKYAKERGIHLPGIDVDRSTGMFRDFVF